MGKKKTKTSSTETSRTVTTPTRPDWVDAQARGLNDALTGLGAQDPAARVAATLLSGAAVHGRLPA